MNAPLAVAGAVYAARQNIAAPLAVPIVAAFLLQVSFYLVPGFPEVRRRLEHHFSPARLALLAVAAAVAPYLVYSLPTGVFHFRALLELAAVCSLVTFVFVLCPVSNPGLAWQDAVAGGTVALVTLARGWRRIYLSPIQGVHLEVMGQIMILGLGAIAFLSLRRLEDTGFQWRTSRAEWKTGMRQFVLFLPVGLAAAYLTGVARFHPVKADPWMYPVLVAGTFLGFYFKTALFEEFFFRGLLQNLTAASLGRPLAAQVITSIVFGLCHLSFRGFPNWRFALVATLIGWFCGQAYRERRSVVASTIAHTLIITSWRLLFPG